MIFLSLLLDIVFSVSIVIGLTSYILRKKACVDKRMYYHALCHTREKNADESVEFSVRSKQIRRPLREILKNMGK